ncbi:MAG: hypothetical protein COA79_16565 [Planctomycetota bacterium]|nr:MAG: hypothetical protein COA79_16565 [Planctomycetota bacterium]
MISFQATMPSILILILMFIGTVGVTIFLYKKERLSKPWSYLLPALRIIAIALFFSILLQPVITKKEEVPYKGIIPIIIDDSGSMSIFDSYKGREFLNLALALKLLKLEEIIDPFKSVISGIKNTSEKIKSIKESMGVINPEKPNGNKIDSLEIIKTDLKNQFLEFEKHKNANLKSDLFMYGFINNVKGKKSISLIANNFKETEIQLKELFKQSKVNSFVKKQDSLIQICEELSKNLKDIQDKYDEFLIQAKNGPYLKIVKSLKEKQRLELLKLYFKNNPEFLNTLNEKGNVKIYSLKEDGLLINRNQVNSLKANLTTTRLGSVVRNVLRQYEGSPVSSIILISDGNLNSGRTLDEVREMVKEIKVPLYNIGVGRVEQPEDLILEKISGPLSSFVDDNISLSGSVLRKGFEDQIITVQVKREDGELLKEIKLKPEKKVRSFFTISFIEKKSGLQKYITSVKSAKKEKLIKNNHKENAVHILKDPIKTLLIDEYPRWESRYANMMLKRDRRMDFKTIFLGSASKKIKQSLPKTKDDFKKYHIIILGDVNPRHFSQEQLLNLKEFVSEQGGTLLLMSGSNHMPKSYYSTILRDIFPIKQQLLDKDMKKSSRIFLELTDSGRLDSITKIGINEEETSELWKSLPQLNWIEKNSVSTEVAETSVHAKRSRHPLLIKSFAGAGKILYMGSDEFWRWRYKARWEYHHRLWGQILLWATLGRTRGNNQNVKLMTEKGLYSPDETINIKAKLITDKQKPLTKATASLFVKNSKGEIVKNIQLDEDDLISGEYRGFIKNLPEGKYTLQPNIIEFSDKNLGSLCSFEVKDLPTSEYVKLPLNEESLKKFSDIYKPLVNANDILEKVPVINESLEKINEIELWHSFWIMLLATVILGTEWQLRKRMKLL